MSGRQGCGLRTWGTDPTLARGIEGVLALRHDDVHVHRHTHGTVNPDIAASERGIWAVKLSFFVLCITALIQVYVVWISGSVALLADTIHNFGDAATALPLGLAFRLARRPPSQRFTYGYGRVEDLAGVIIVVLILFSAVAAGYEAFGRLIHPETLAYPTAVAVAAIVGFMGNEAVAVFRLRVGEQIHSAALIADAHHARVDGWTSLSVLAGAMGAWLGYPIVDPIVGLLITAAIGRIVWQSAILVFGRLLDRVDPGIVDEIRNTVANSTRLHVGLVSAGSRYRILGDFRGPALLRFRADELPLPSSRRNPLFSFD